jgi:hypothetical protein
MPKQDVHPLVNFDHKPEPSDYPTLPACDIKVDGKSKFPGVAVGYSNRLPDSC